MKKKTKRIIRLLLFIIAGICLYIGTRALVSSYLIDSSYVYEGLVFFFIGIPLLGKGLYMEI